MAFIVAATLWWLLLVNAGATLAASAAPIPEISARFCSKRRSASRNAEATEANKTPEATATPTVINNLALIDRPDQKFTEGLKAYRILIETNDNLCDRALM